MGFGLLLVGYFTATIMSLNVCGGAFAFIGYFIVVFGAKKLSLYNRSFLYLLWSSLVLLLLSVFLAVYDVSALLHEYFIIPAQPIEYYCYDIALKIRLFFTIYLSMQHQGRKLHLLAQLVLVRQQSQTSLIDSIISRMAQLHSMA